MYLASRIVLFVSGVLMLVASFLTWYAGRTFKAGRPGISHTEMAWQGEESLAAVLILLLLAVLGAAGFFWRKGRLWLGVLEMIGAVVCLVLILFFIVHNSGVTTIRNVRIESRIGPGAYLGLATTFGLLVAAALGIIGALLQRPRKAADDWEWE